MEVDKKIKKKNIFTAIGLIVFILLLFVFTLYNVGAVSYTHLTLPTKA